MEKWTLIFWMGGKKYDEHILEKETPIPRMGERVRIPEISLPLEAICYHSVSKAFDSILVTSVQYDFTNKDVYVYLKD